MIEGLDGFTAKDIVEWFNMISEQEEISLDHIHVTIRVNGVSSQCYTLDTSPVIKFPGGTRTIVLLSNEQEED